MIYGLINLISTGARALWNMSRLHVWVTLLIKSYSVHTAHSTFALVHDVHTYTSSQTTFWRSCAISQVILEM